jgi:hypothetical protein
VGISQQLSGRPEVIRVVAVVVILLGGAGLGALRMTPADDDAGTATTEFVASTSSSTTITTAAPATSVPPDPTTTSPATSETTVQLPLTPLPNLQPTPTTTPTTAPPTTAPPTTTRNQPPIARDDTAKTSGAEIINIPVLANDNDPDGQLDRDTLQVDKPAHGTTGTDPSTGTVYYQRTDGFQGADKFRYYICDNHTPEAACTSAVVTVTGG